MVIHRRAHLELQGQLFAGFVKAFPPVSQRQSETRQIISEKIFRACLLVSTSVCESLHAAETPGSERIILLQKPGV